MTLLRTTRNIYKKKHTLTSFKVDTNIDCSVLIIDSYYMIRFRTTQVAEYVLYLTYKLRSTWNKLLNLRISRGVGKVEKTLYRQGTIY